MIIILTSMALLYILTIHKKINNNIKECIMVWKDNYTWVLFSNTIRKGRRGLTIFLNLEMKEVKNVLMLEKKWV
jgi:hypothetical protein